MEVFSDKWAIMSSKGYTALQKRTKLWFQRKSSQLIFKIFPETQNQSNYLYRVVFENQSDQLRMFGISSLKKKSGKEKDM